MTNKLETIPTLHVNQQLPGENPAEVFAKLGRELPMALLDANPFLNSASLVDPSLQDTLTSLDSRRWRTSESLRQLRPEQTAHILQVATVALEHLSGEPMVALQPEEAPHEQYAFAPNTDPAELYLLARRNIDVLNLNIKTDTTQSGLGHTVYGAAVLLSGRGAVQAAVADLSEGQEDTYFHVPENMTHSAVASGVTVLAYIAQAPRNDLQADDFIRPTAYGILPTEPFGNATIIAYTAFGRASEW